MAGDLMVFEGAKEAIVEVRGRAVMIDADVARFFGDETKRLNEQVKRNTGRFDEDYCFQLTREEVEPLRSHFATANPTRGGRTNLPRVFTELGVVMAATILKSAAAAVATKRIVEAFVAMKELRRAQALAALKPSGSLATLGASLAPKLQAAFEAVIAYEINPREGTNIRQETEALISDGLSSLKARLQRAGYENAEIEARVAKLFAEEEEIRARAAKERNLSDQQALRNQANRLRLLIQADVAMRSDDPTALLATLAEIGNAK
jgi:hypothetical protein